MLRAGARGRRSGAGLLLPAQGGEVAVRVGCLHLGGRALLDGTPATGGGNAVGGLRVTLLAPDAAGTSSEVRPSINLGIGWQWPLSKQVALRTELRTYLTLVNSSSGLSSLRRLRGSDQRRHDDPVRGPGEPVDRVLSPMTLPSEILISTQEGPEIR